MNDPVNFRRQFLKNAGRLAVALPFATLNQRLSLPFAWAAARPDRIVSTEAEVRGQIETWIRERTTGPKTIAVDRSLTGRLDLRNLRPKFPITIRPLGVFSSDSLVNPDCSVVFRGVDLTGAQNIRMYLCKFADISTNSISVTNSKSVTFERCFIRGKTGISGIPVTTILMNVANTDRLTIKHCLFMNSLTAHLYFSGVDNVLTRIEGCVFENSGHDDVKCITRMRKLTFINNWFSRARFGPKKGVHDDGFQVQNGGWYDAYIRGNVLWRTNELWRGGIGGTQQGIWVGGKDVDVDLVDVRFEQNILLTDNNGIKAKNTGIRDVRTRYNLLYTVPAPNGKGNNYLSGGKDNDYNCVVASNNGGVGQRGLFLDTVDQNNLDYGIPDREFKYGGPRGTANSYVVQLTPRLGSRLHWEHFNPAGAHVRTREIVDHNYRKTLAKPVIPADVGWPVASVWTKRFNADRGVVTDFQNRYDNDGNNR